MELSKLEQNNQFILENIKRIKKEIERLYNEEATIKADMEKAYHSVREKKESIKKTQNSINETKQYSFQTK